jgi:aldehyde:ferredoxin oxidoreductase
MRRRLDLMSITRRVLRVDLTRGSLQTEPLPLELYQHYLGGRGIGARILFDEVRADTDPLSPDNILIISAGALAGTFAPASARLTVTSKSPETGIYCKSSVGGHWSPELKFAGYDVVVIKGKAKAPVYLSIRDDKVEIVDASRLWGMDVRETNRALKEELDDERISVLAIGAAGENLVRYASIVSNIYRQAARGGMGCVMGSKNLKAIAVRGTNVLEVANPAEFKDVALHARDLVRDDLDRYYRYHFFGANRGLVGANEVGFNPTKNFQTSYLKGAFRTGGEYIRERYVMRENGCGSCVFCCGKFYEIEDGPYAGTHSEGPEWEAGNAFGARIGNTDTEFVLKANEICNINGLDLSSTMSAVAFAMECFEKGLLTKKETDGLSLEWGNTDAVLVLLKKIVKREGMGSLLSLPIKEVVQKVGRGSDKYAMHIKGLGLTSVDLRSTIPYALAFAVNPRGGDHLHTEIICQFGANPEHIEIANRISGSPEGSDRFSFEGKAKLVKYHEAMVCASDCLGICFFHTLSSHRVSPELHAGMYESATGISMDVKNLLLAGERILTLERLFNVREGLTAKDDYIPQRFLEEAVPDGPAKGKIISKSKFEKLLQEYYEEHGWDSHGIPKKKTLRGLGLEELAKIM